jgi:hypothetical protein
MVPRDPISVAKQIREAIPARFHLQLDRLIETFNYKPPEAYRDCFYILAEFIGETLYEGQEYLIAPWQIKVASIFSTKSEEEIILHNEKLRPVR